MKRLLLITQTVDLDDSVLAFTHSWINEFATNFDKVSVICLREGRHDLKSNVKVYSLGKENGVSRIKYLIRFFKYVTTLRNEYDDVFVHMNQVYAILGGLLWRLWGKKVSLSYVHRQTSISLYVALQLVDAIFTSSPESFRIKSNKVVYFGHAIDTDKFRFKESELSLSGSLNLISVGRVTPIKHLEVIIDAISILRDSGIKAFLKIIGSPVYKSDHNYQKVILDKVKKLKLEEQISFVGSVNNNDLPEVYAKSDISINACPTGGLDKAVIEAMSSGLISVTSNLAFDSYFGEFKNLLIFEFGNANSLAEKIIAIKNHEKIETIRGYLRHVAVEEFDQRKTIKLISDRIKNL